MPLFATLVSGAINGLISFYSLVLGYQQAIAWARRTFIVLLMVAFFAAVKVCVGSLLGMVASSAIPSGFAMGLGMFIPSNAGPVLACLGSVWLACVTYRLKLDGLKW